MNCWRCGTGIEVDERVGFRDSCPKCDRPVHICRNCGFYDPGYHNQCRETMAELVADKERSNFCDFFTPAGGASTVGPAKSAVRAPARSTRDELEKLFKKR